MKGSVAQELCLYSKQPNLACDVGVTYYLGVRSTTRITALLSRSVINTPDETQEPP